MKLANSINKADKHENTYMQVPASLLKSIDFKMKRIIYLSLVLPLILFSCESTPEAHFFTDNVEIEVGDEVYFTNDSHNANRFEWDFGDGYVSDDENPVHTFTISGGYEVKLTAFSKSGLSDVATITIEVLIPSMLVIDVLEYYDEYPVSNASVILYPDLTSWDSEENMVAEGFTDDNGQVVFSHLDYRNYYVDVWEEHHNNYVLRDEDVGFIITDLLAPNKVTYFIAWVDYFESKKGDARRENTYVIKKLERKTADKSVMSTEMEDWQTLYDKSIKVK